MRVRSRRGRSSPLGLVALAILWRYLGTLSYAGYATAWLGPGQWKPHLWQHSHGQRRRAACRQEGPQMAPKLKLAEVEHIHTASRAKAFEAIAVGNLPPGLELELISALDLGTVPCHCT